MIIINVEDSNNLTASEIDTIAICMVNMQLGLEVVAPDGSINEGKCDDYNPLIHDEIEYNITGVMGHLVFADQIRRLYSVDSDTMIGLNAKVKQLLVRVAAEKPGIQVFSTQSSDFINVSTKTITDDTHIVDNSGITRNAFRWKLTGPSLFDVNSGGSIEKCEFDIASSHMAIYITEGHTYTFDQPITKLNRAIQYSDYQLFNRLIAKKSLQWHSSFKFADLMYMIKGKSLQDYTPLTGKHRITAPIYAEDWKNIKPSKLLNPKQSQQKKWMSSKQIKYFKSEYKGGSYTSEQLEDIRDESYGAPAPETDKCHGCYMPLYDDIYVIETHVRHICVCAVCIYNAMDDIKTHEFTILRTTYPRTAIDIIHNDTTLTPIQKNVYSCLIKRKNHFNTRARETVVVDPVFGDVVVWHNKLHDLTRLPDIAADIPIVIVY
jgi:hypothetical protein